MNPRLLFGLFVFASLLLAGCSQEDLLKASVKVGCCNLEKANAGQCELEGEQDGVELLSTKSCDAIEGTCVVEMKYKYNSVDEFKKITTTTTDPFEKAVPFCKADTMDNPCIQRQCVAQVCGPFDFVPESIISYKDNIELSQKMESGESDDEDAPSNDRPDTKNLYGTKCMNLDMDENLTRVFSNTRGSMVNIFRLGIGTSFQDFDKYRLLFPFSDLSCNVYPFISAKERYTNYFRLENENPLTNLANTFNNLTYCPTEQGKSPLRNDLYGDVNQPPNYKFESVTSIADGQIRFSYEKFDDNFYDQLLRWTDRGTLRMVEAFSVPKQAEFECSAPSDCRSGMCDQNVYRRGMCQRTDGRWVNCECYGNGMFCAGETVIYPETIGVSSTQTAVSQYDSGYPLYVRIQRQSLAQKLYQDSGFLWHSSEFKKCYIKGDGFGADYSCFFAEKQKEEYPYYNYFNCIRFDDNKYDCSYLSNEYNDRVHFLFYDMGDYVPGVNGEGDPFDGKKLLSPTSVIENECSSESCGLGKVCNYGLGKCVAAESCVILPNTDNSNGPCDSDLDCPIEQICKSSADGSNKKCTYVECDYSSGGSDCRTRHCDWIRLSGNNGYYCEFDSREYFNTFEYIGGCGNGYYCSLESTDENGVGLGYCKLKQDPEDISCRYAGDATDCPIGYICDIHNKCILNTNYQCPSDSSDCQTTTSVDSGTYLLDCDQAKDPNGQKIEGNYLCGGATIGLDKFEPLPSDIDFLQNPPNGIYFYGKEMRITDISDDQPGSDFRISDYEEGETDNVPTFIGYTFLPEYEFKQTNFYKTCGLTPSDYSVIEFQPENTYYSSNGNSEVVAELVLIYAEDYDTNPLYGAVDPFSHGGGTAYYRAGQFGADLFPFDNLVNNRGYGHLSGGDTHVLYSRELILLKNTGECKTTPSFTPVSYSLGWCDACSYLTMAQQTVESSDPSYTTLQNEYRRSSDSNQEPYKTVTICEEEDGESECTLRHKDGVSTIKLLDYMDKTPESTYLLTSGINDLKEGVMPVLDVSDNSNWEPLKAKTISDTISSVSKTISDIDSWLVRLNRAKEDTLGIQSTIIHRPYTVKDPETGQMVEFDDPITIDRSTMLVQLDGIISHLTNAKSNLTVAREGLKASQSLTEDYETRLSVTSSLPLLQKASDELAEARKITGPCEVVMNEDVLNSIVTPQETYLNNLVYQIRNSVFGIDDAISFAKKAIEYQSDPTKGNPVSAATVSAQYADSVQKETYRASQNMRTLNSAQSTIDLMYQASESIRYAVPAMTASDPDYNLGLLRLATGKVQSEVAIDAFNSAYETNLIDDNLPSYCNDMYKINGNALVSGQESELEKKLSKAIFKLSWELTRLADAVTTEGPSILLVQKVNLAEITKEYVSEIQTRALIARSICGNCLVAIQVDNGPEASVLYPATMRKTMYFATLKALNRSDVPGFYDSIDGIAFKFFPNEYIAEKPVLCDSDDGIYNMTIEELQDYGYAALTYRKFSFVNEMDIQASKYPSCWNTKANEDGDEKQNPLFKLFSRLTLHQRSLTQAGVIGLFYTGTDDFTKTKSNGAVTYSDQFCAFEQASRYYVSEPAITIYQKVPIVDEATCIKCNALDISNGQCKMACGNGVDCEMPEGTSVSDRRIYKCPDNMFPAKPATPCNSFPPQTNITCSLVYASGKMETVKFDASQLSDATPDVIASLPDEYKCSLSNSESGDYTYTKVNIQGKTNAPNIFSYAADPTEDCGLPDPNLALPAECGAVSPNMRSYSMSCTFDTKPRWPMTCNQFISCPTGMTCNYNKGPICVGMEPCTTSKECYDSSYLTSCSAGKCQNIQCNSHSDCPSDAVCDKRYGFCTYSPCKSLGFPCEELLDSMCDLSVTSPTYGQCIFKRCGAGEECPSGTICSYQGEAHCVDNPCKSHSDCPAGELCTASPPNIGICAQSSCDADSDCPLFYSCLDSECRSVPCTTNDVCQSAYPGTYCDFTNYICRYPRPCTTGADCSAVESCEPSPQGGSTCMPLTCDYSNYFYNFDKCPEGSICDFSKKICIMSECASNGDCPPYSACYNGKCTQTWCQSDNDCPIGLTCEFVQKNSGSGDSLYMCMDKYCDLDLECDSGMICDPETKKCVAGQSCSGPSDCAANQICSLAERSCSTVDCERVCTTLTCSEYVDQRCIQQKSYCNLKTGTCEQKYCSSESDCPSDTICDEGYCKRVACQGDGSNCAFLGAYCDSKSKLCLQESCTGSADCSEGSICQNNKCIQQHCSIADNSCPSGTICNFASGYCAKPPSCDSNYDRNRAIVCEDSYCDNGVCKQKTCSETSVSDCPAGTICDVTYNTCISAPGCSASKMQICTAADPYSICSADEDSSSYGYCEKKSCTVNFDCVGLTRTSEYGPGTDFSARYSVCDPSTGLCKESSCRNNADCPSGYICDTSFSSTRDVTYPHICQLEQPANGCPAGSGPMTINLATGSKTICYYPVYTYCATPLTMDLGGGKKLVYCSGDCDYDEKVFYIVDSQGKSIKTCAK